MMKQRNWALSALLVLVISLLSVTASAGSMSIYVDSDHSIEMTDVVHPTSADVPEVTSPLWQIVEYRNPIADFIAAEAKRTAYRLLVYDSFR